MTDQYIDKILEDLEDDLSKHSPPVVCCYKKKISATYGFNSGMIPKVKIIADRETWLKWFYNFDENSIRQPLKHVSRPKPKVLNDLLHYALEQPENFKQDFFNCVIAANTKNPSYGPATKSRKQIYDLDKGDKWEVYQMTARLYVFFTSEQWHNCMEEFLKSYKLEILDIHSTAKKRRNAVEKVISAYYGFKSPRFWQTFVKENPISLKYLLHSEQAKKVINPDDDPWLAKLFEEFKAPSK